MVKFASPAVLGREKLANVWFCFYIAECMVSIILPLLKATGKVLFYPFLRWQDNKMYNTSLYKQFTLISCRLMSRVESDDC